MSVNEHQSSSAGSTMDPCMTREGAASSDKGFGSFPFKKYICHFKYVPDFLEPPYVMESPVGEHQFKLIEKEFRCQISDHCPEIRIYKESSRVIFEGPNDEVTLGVKILEELVKKVQKQVVHLSTVLLTFIKSSSAIQRYLSLFEKTLEHTVSLEVGSQLVLCSLSLEALNEAETILRSDISLITVQLLDIEAALLRRVTETMTEATNQENAQELRVNTNFIPTPTHRSVTEVQLVGYTESVSNLKEILHKSLMSQSDAQEVLSLPADSVERFDSVLKMIRPWQTEVTLQASLAPNPYIVLTGPPSMVQEALKNAKATLATLTSDTLLFDGPGAHWYFQTEGKQNMLLIQRLCQVVIEDTINVTGVTGGCAISAANNSEGPQGNHSNKLQIKVKLGQLVNAQVWPFLLYFT